MSNSSTTSNKNIDQFPKLQSQLDVRDTKNPGYQIDFAVEKIQSRLEVRNPGLRNIYCNGMNLRIVFRLTKKTSV
jgi:hypothetical protein